MLGIFLSLLTALLKSLGELTGKFLTHEKQKNAIDEYSLAFSIRCIVTCIMLGACIIAGFTLPPISFLGVIFLGASINAITTVTALKAVKYGDMSLVGPLSSLTIPFLILTSYIILGELPNVYGLLGVFIIFIGTYILGVKNIAGGFLSPIKNIISNPGAKYMLLTALLWSISAPIDKLGLIEIGTFHWLLYTNIFTSILLGIYTLGVKKTAISELVYFKNIKKSILYAGVLGTGMIIQMFALKLTLAVYVISIKRASGIFSVILGAVFFKEKHILQKLIAASIMLLGVFIITLFGNI